MLNNFRKQNVSPRLLLTYLTDISKPVVGRVGLKVFKESTLYTGNYIFDAMDKSCAENIYFHYSYIMMNSCLNGTDIDMLKTCKEEILRTKYIL